MSPAKDAVKRKIGWTTGWFSLQERFVKIYLAKIAPHSAKVYCVLSSGIMPGEEREITIPEMMRLCGCSRATVFRSLEDLVENELIQRDSGARDGEANTYLILDLGIVPQAKEEENRGVTGETAGSVTIETPPVSADGLEGSQDLPGTRSLFETPNKEEEKRVENTKEQAPASQVTVQMLVDYFHSAWNSHPDNHKLGLSCSWSNKRAFKEVKGHIERADDWRVEDHYRAIDNYFQSDGIVAANPPEIVFSAKFNLKKYVGYALNKYGNGPKEQLNGKANTGWSPAAKEQRNRSAATEAAFRIINGGNQGGDVGSSDESGHDEAPRGEETPVADS